MTRNTIKRFLKRKEAQLSNGEQYKLTTKKWLTPKGTWVHNEGIRPAIEVGASLEYYENPTEENDNQLRAAFNYIKTLR